MKVTSSNITIIRNKEINNQFKVTFIELFFDLVFVFAITQLSHNLLKEFNLVGALQTGLLLLSVWWVWIFTVWATNWLNPESTIVKIILCFMMLIGLILSMSIPEAFHKKGLIFALAYVGMQIGRCLFMCWVFYKAEKKKFLNFIRITIWLSLAAIFWILGGINEGDLRLVLWGTAILIEYMSPIINFWIPKLGRSKTTEWNISGEHIAERCGLFIIIALGESILVTGMTFGQMVWTLTHAMAFLNSFICTVSIWWIYFNVGAEQGSHYISKSKDPGRVARIAYTYLHVFLVAAIILVAVTDELVLEHPFEYINSGTPLVIIGGPILYILSNLFFKRIVNNYFSKSHLFGVILLLILSLFYSNFSPLLLSSTTTLILLGVALYEINEVRRCSAKSKTFLDSRLACIGKRFQEQEAELASGEKLQNS